MRLRRNARLGNQLHRQTRGLRLEPLESRTLLSATPTDDSFRLSIFVDDSSLPGSAAEEIPSDVGVASNDSTQSLFTVDDSGEIYLDSASGQTLGDLFDIWQNNAGVAGNRTDAVLTEDQLLGNIADGDMTVQMFVNGEVSKEFEDYAVQDGDEIVLIYTDNPVLSINTNYGPIVIELYEGATPKTVENFLNYVNDGDYIDSFFHRSVEGFVIQGGGFTTSSTTFTDTDQFSSVPTDDPVENEPGISNLRGTIAMAKLGGDPDSATSQYFVNLTNNHATSGATLDTQNGGFTVFGQVLDMTTADTIADLTITAASTIDTTISTSDASLYSSLPLGTSNTLAVVESLSGQGTLSGIKYLDENHNGQYDSGEDLLGGVTVYLDANDNGQYDSGEVSTTTDTDGTYRFQVEAGEYTLRSEVTAGRVATEPLAPDSYSVTVEIGGETTGLDFGEIDLPAPTGLDLLAASDTGGADDDNLTKNNNSDQALAMQFLVSGVAAGAEVQIYDGTTLIGSAVATSDTVTVTTDGTHTLSDGVHNITAVQALGGTSDPTDALEITIDTAAPSGLTNQMPETTQAGVAFSFDASSAEEGDITYSLSDAPTGMSIDASTGEISWTPTTGQAEPQSFDIILTDEAGNSLSESQTLTVLGAIPAYPDEYSVVEDTTLAVSAAEGVLSNDDTNSGTLTVATIDLPSHGNLTLSSDGSFTYTPHADFYGTDTFTYQATNTTSDESNVALVTITVTAANDPPVGTADNYTVSEDTTLTRTASTGVLANDTDTDTEEDTLTATLVTQPEHGTLTLNSNGSFSYVPTADYNGTDSFTYKVSDGTNESAPVTVTLTVTAVNDAPTSLADTYSVNEDSTLTVAVADGVLDNDSDLDSDSFSAMINSTPTSGTVTLNADGSFVYTPDADFFGTDTFTYLATDGSESSTETTVTITVNAQADAPVASDDTYTAPNDGTSVLIDVLANDTSSPDGNQTLTITSVSQGSAGGTVTIEGNKLRYTAQEGTLGTETITYTITDTDGLTDTATLTVTVVDASDNTISGFVYVDADGDGTRDSGETGVPGVLVTLTGTDNFGNAVNHTALTADDGSYSFAELTSGTYKLTERQPTAMGDGSDSSAVSGAVVADDVISNLVISDSGTFGENNFGEAGLLPQYISVKFFFASAPPIAECLRDAIAQAEATAGYDDLAEAIRNGDTSFEDSNNNLPVAANDTYSIDEDGTLSIPVSTGVLANDSDADGDSLGATLVTDVSHGTLNLKPNGSFSYEPDADYHGTDTFTYQVSDGLGNSDIATVTITVSPVNDAPEADADSYSAAKDTTLTIAEATGVLANDTDVDDDTLTASLVSDVSHGTLTLNANGSFTYVPDSGYVGTDTFTYKANDGTANSATATVTIVVNTPPEADNDSYTVNEDQTLTVNETNGVLTNDSDDDGDTLTASVTVQPEHGTLSFNPNGSFTYTPEADFNGTDTFKYAANDGVHDSEEATVTITVAAVNDAPVAENDAYDIEVDGTLTVTADDGVLDNDTDADGDSLTAVIETEPSHGTLTFNGDGSFTYTPESGYHGDDTFTYKANDGTVDSAVATVTINVNAIPEAGDDSYTIDEDGTLTTDNAAGVLANDSDADGDTLTATVVSQPTHGTLTLNTDGSFTYTPDANYHGSDSFSYKANDGTHDSPEAAVTITINSVNDDPVAEADSYSVPVNGQLNVIAGHGVLSNDSDVDDDTITPTVATEPGHGTLSLNADGSFTYVPEADYHGTDTFTYKVNDGTSDSEPATVTITVNTPAVAVDDTYSTTMNTQLTVLAEDGVLANDSDLEDDTLTPSVITQPSHGALTLNADGSFVYVPATDYYGADSFTYQVNDGFGNSTEATVTIQVNAIPVAVDDEYSVDEDTALTVDVAGGVLDNDSDADADTLTVTVTTDPSHGTVTLNPDGSFTYTPEADYAGTDTFSYVANDGTSDSAHAKVTITIASIDDTPQADDDAYSVLPNNTLTTSTSEGILANDTDGDGDTLTITVVTQPEHGTLTLNTDGSFSYEPTQDYHGTDTFTYKVNDGTSDSETATVTIDVNTPPNATSDVYTVNEDEQLTVDAGGGVLSNDPDADSDTLTATIVLQPSHGTLTLETDGSFAYTPDADYSGEDSFSYVANDGFTDSVEATVVITVAATQDAPLAVDDSYSVPVNGSLSVDATGGVITNDTDPDGDSLTAAVASGPANGQVALNANGSFTYTPNADFHGTDTFTYVVNDGTADSGAATVTIDVNTLASAGDDTYSVNEDETLTVDAVAGVLANDSDADSDSLTAVLVTGPANGTLILDTDGSFEYTPNADFNGDDSFTYQANDGFGNSSETTVTITVGSVNDVPDAVDDSYAVLPNGVLNVNAATGVLANDSDADDDSFNVVLVAGPAHGTLLINGDGAFQYTPEADYEGIDTFTYKVNDGTTDSETATVTIHVNNPPSATSDSYSVNEDVVLTVDAASGLLNNDSDLNDDPLTATIVQTPSHGTVTLDADGSFVYTPETDYSGEDTFTYVANDGAADSAETTVVITVVAVQDAPVAVDDLYIVSVNGTLNVSTADGVVNNDADPDGDSLTVTVTASPTNGQLTPNSDGSFTYAPNTDFHGTDTFTYTLNDGTADSNTATVTINVNTLATASDDTYTVAEDGTLAIDSAAGVLANDSDADSDSLTAALATGPANGTVTLDANGSFEYTPNSDFHGTDSFTYQANDGFGNSVEATVTINVTPINDAPEVTDDSYPVLPNGVLNLNADAGTLANDSDADGDTLTVVLVAGPTHGTLQLETDGAFKYTPNTDYEGTDTFTYKVNDGTIDSLVASVTLNVDTDAALADQAFAEEQDWI